MGRKERGEVTNKVWTSDDGTDWQLSLPPMSNKRCFPLAVNTGPSPECMIVAGGEGEDHTHLPVGLTVAELLKHSQDNKILTMLEVLLEEQWFTVPTSPRRLTSLPHVSVHNGVVYFSASDGLKYIIMTSSIESLLAACTQSHDVRLDMQVEQISLSKQDY